VGVEGMSLPSIDQIQVLVVPVRDPLKKNQKKNIDNIEPS
jgi:hypothetical protein